MKCPHCGFENEKDFELCPECGKSFDDKPEKGNETAKEEKKGKNISTEQKKTLIIIAVVLALLAAAAIAAGVYFGIQNGKPAAMTDANGETVTDIDGEQVTLPKGYDYVRDESGAYVTDGWGVPQTTLVNPDAVTENPSGSDGGKPSDEYANFTPPAHIKISDDTPWKGDGVYRAGKDIKAGEYLVVSSGNCYVSVSPLAEPTSKDKIASKLVKTHMYISVENGQYLTVERGFFIPASKVEKIEPIDGKYGEGMYKLGQDIPEKTPLNVFSNEGEEAYLEQNKDASGNIKKIAANINFSGRKTFKPGKEIAYVTVKRGWLEVVTRPEESQAQ